MILEIRVNIPNTNVPILGTVSLARVGFPVYGLQMFDNDGCEESFPYSGIPLAKEGLLAALEPHLELVRLDKPLASPGLPHFEKLVLLGCIVAGSEPLNHT